LDEVTDAISKSHGAAVGPDDVHHQMLKHLPNDALLTLLNILNNIWASGKFPTSCCTSTVIPVPKPGKDTSDPFNYRPIALTSCICKVMERMINSRLVWYLERNKLISAMQSGFRKQRSTTDHLVRLESFVREAFAQRQHAVGVFFWLRELFNRSLSKGQFPAIFKDAFITPALKKPGLDAADVSSYRPISNLSVLSKLLERLVARQLMHYLSSTNLLPSLQSGFRPGHSTETAVLRVLSDILQAVDQGDVAALILLDLSAAFDTVDHPILLQRLRSTFGFGGIAHRWLGSYLSGRCQYVRRGSARSTVTQLVCGVPQGSVLGPILFVLYTVDLLSLIESYSLSPHLYADDTQVYGSCSPAAVDAFSLQVTECVDAIATWMMSNRLQLNPSKTEVLWCATSRRQHQLPKTPMLIDSVPVTPVSCVRDLGIYVDGDLSMRTHVKRAVSCCFAALRQLRQIRRSVPTATFQTLVVALVHSRLDYGNGVLVGIPDYLVQRLQSVLNAAARMTFHLKRSDHITDALVSLHWLRVSERIQFKVAVLTYKVLNGSAPPYLGPLTRVADVPGRRALRSADTHQLVVPSYRLSTVGSRAFPVAAARIWNTLPVNVVSASTVQSFRHKLKSFLFDQSFPN